MLDSSRAPLRPTVARVSLSAIASNFRALRSVAAPADVCAVVKANAYGHGMGPVSRCLQDEGCRQFAVGTVDEGLELRSQGVRGEILLLQGCAFGHAPLLVAERLTPVVSDLETLEALGGEAQRGGFVLPIHLKFDTGMGRLGLRPEEAATAVEALARQPALRLAGVATHFARAGECAEATARQFGLFCGVLEFMAAAGVQPGTVHAANSAACLSVPASRFDCVRVGLALYGVLPEPDLPFAPPLKPALTWVSEVERLREVPAGASLSYGSTFTTSRPSRIAVVPVGYADGYRRALGNRACVLLRGRRAPVVGRVTMDLILVDATDVTGVQRGDEVVLIGSQGDEVLSACEMAGLLDTIPYEILCGVGPRVPRVYEEEG